MKKTFILTFIWLFVANTFAQSPDLFSYQAVVRDNAGAVISSKVVSIKFSILKTTATGTAQFVETHKPTTDANGLISIEIGGGSVTSGSISTIDWATDKYFLKVELDPAGGSSYSNMGTTQLISVPYAKHATTADSAITEHQVLRLSNDTIYLSKGGGYVVIPDSSLLGVRQNGAGGIGAGGSAKLKDFDNKFNNLIKIGTSFRLHDLQTDAQKNIYLVGEYSRTMTIGSTKISATNSGNRDFIAKLDSNAKLIWVKEGDNTRNMNINSIIVEKSGNAYVVIGAGYNKNSILWDGITYPSKGLILKLNSSGNVAWSKAFEGKYKSDGVIFKLAYSTSSELYLTGGYGGLWKFGTDSFKFQDNNNRTITYGLFKISSNGNTTILLDSAADATGEDVLIDAQNNVYVHVSDYSGEGRIDFKTKSISFEQGTGIIKYNSMANIIDSITTEVFGAGLYGAKQLIGFDGNNLVCVGTGFEFTLGGNYYGGHGQPFVVKLDQSLNFISAHVLLINGFGYPRGLAVKNNGDIFMGVQTYSSYVIDEVNYKPLCEPDFETQVGASLYLQYDNNLALKNHKALSLFQSAEGMFVSASDNTLFIGVDIKGEFYNKGTKQSPGVYLFKE